MVFDISSDLVTTLRVLLPYMPHTYPFPFFDLSRRLHLLCVAVDLFLLCLCLGLCMRMESEPDMGSEMPYRILGSMKRSIAIFR